MIKCCRFFSLKKRVIKSDFKTLMPFEKPLILHALNEIVARTKGENSRLNDFKRTPFTPLTHRGIEFALEEALEILIARPIFSLAYVYDLIYSVYQLVCGLGEALLNLIEGDFDKSSNNALKATCAFINIFNLSLSLIVHVVYIPIEFVCRTLGTILPVLGQHYDEFFEQDDDSDDEYDVIDDVDLRPSDKTI